MHPSELDRALTAINTARFEEANQLLTQLLRRSPGNLDAHFLQGVAIQALNRPEEALARYNKVLKKSPQHAGAHYNKALALAALGRHADALKSHDAAIQLAPGNAWALLNRGNSLAALKRYPAALDDYDHALQIQPDLPQALTNKGNVLMELGRLDESAAHHQRALQLDPGHAQAWANLSAAHIKARRFEDALDAADHALQLVPSQIDGLTHKGAALTALGQVQAALDVLKDATRLAPDHGAAWTALGNAEEALLHYDRALACYDRSLAIDPQSVQAWINKASVLEDVNRDGEAEACYERALALEADNADAHWGLSVLLLKQNRLAAAWDHFEYRWGISRSQKVHVQTQRPRWDGQPSDKPLLLWGEQGPGDQVLYGTILPDLAALPQRKMVALDRRLIPLFQRSLSGFEFIDLETANDALDFAEHLPLGSLPRLFRRNTADFDHAPRPLLTADATRAAALRELVVRPGKRVCGVSWSSSRKDLGTYKSISLEQMLVPLGTESLHFVNLQYGDTAAERAALLRDKDIEIQDIDEVDNFSDLDGLAALIQACDVILTTSNTTAHLAGALGKDTILLLPSGKGRLWYWTDQNGHSLWYPNIVICQQAAPGEWQGPLGAARDILSGQRPG